MRKLLLALCVLPAIGGAAEARVTDEDRFQLWNDCRPVKMTVYGLDAVAGRIGLTERDVRTAARSRLRGARLYTETVKSPGAHLDIKVTIAEFGGFYLNVAFFKYLRDEINGIVGYWPVETWQVPYFGIHGKRPHFVLSSLSQLMDEFVDEYLRVNASACK